MKKRTKYFKKIVQPNIPTKDNNHLFKKIYYLSYK